MTISKKKYFLKYDILFSVIGEKFLNLINHYNEPYFCADEVVCTFTKLSGTQVALKILGQKSKSIKFVQAYRDENIDLFKVLDG